jgi:aminopeptidase N
MEEVSGQDLRGLFQQWLNRSGVPVVDGIWRYDAAAKQIIVTVRQTQAGDVYRFPLDIGVTLSATTLPRVQEVQVTVRETTINIPADAEPVSITLDPGVWLLADFGPFVKAGTR